MTNGTVLLYSAQSLERGRFIRREDDNHARIQLISGPVVVAQCPSEKCFQSGNAPGQTVELTRIQDNGSERLWSLERMWMDKSWVGLNASAALNLVIESVIGNDIESIRDYKSFEKKAIFDCVETGSTKVDVKFSGSGQPDLYVDVRNVTRLDEDTLRYPDFPQQEDIKRLDGFESMIDAGARVVLFYAINRVHGEWFEPGYDVDPEYAARLEEAQAAGVELLVSRVRHLPTSMALSDIGS